MNLNYPEWFKVEKEAATVIKGLYNFKDLSFYLNNSNPYIRSQAILRVNELKPTESLNVLEEILNNPLETAKNKELAGWTIKAIALEHKLNLFIANPIINNYSGTEDYSQSLNIDIFEPSDFQRLDFSSPPLYSGPDLEEDYLVRDQEIDFESTFNFQEWFQIWKATFLSKLIVFLKDIPSYLKIGLRKAIAFFWYRLLQKIFIGCKDYLIKLYYQKKNNINLIDLVKSFFFYILCIILAPFRFVRRHKSLFVCTLVLLLFYFGYTTDSFTIPTFSLHSGSEKPLESILETGQDLALSAWTEANSISSLWFTKIRSTNLWQNIQEYIIMAIDFIKK